MAAAGLVAVTSVAGMPAVSCSLQSSNRSSISSSVTPLRKAFGLHSSGMGRIICYKEKFHTPRHKVTFHTPTGKKVVEVDRDKYLLDAAKEAGLDLPSSCRKGECGTCAGKLRSGKVDQSKGRYLDDKQLSPSFVLTCVAYATEDLEIDTHKEEDLNSSLEGRKDEEQVRRKKEEEEEEISSKRRRRRWPLIFRTVLRI